LKKLKLLQRKIKMKNSFGNSISVSLFGESHGKAIGAVLDGLAPGISIDMDYINEKLALRRGDAELSTARREGDEVQILSGVFMGKTTGTPLALIIENNDTKSRDYSDFKIMPRPSHADYTAECKYHGYEDYRGGGHFSGRVTAALVAAGAILMQALEGRGIYIGTHIKELHGECDREFENYENDIKALSKKSFPALSSDSEAKMKEEIASARADGDSVGGILESAVIGVPAGVGEPFFDSVESVLSHLLFSIPAVKGVEFGLGFRYSDAYGSLANDEFCFENGSIATKTNNNGGILGGITNAMPIIVRSAIKPTPSIYKPQNTVNLASGENTVLTVNGRHDPAIIHRARAVVDAVLAIGIADLLTVRFGTDYLSGSCG
jgi:chorismate synthase